jgi:hypothetical protein
VPLKDLISRLDSLLVHRAPLARYPLHTEVRRGRLWFSPSNTKLRWPNSLLTTSFWYKSSHYSWLCSFKFHCLSSLLLQLTVTGLRTISCLSIFLLPPPLISMRHQDKSGFSSKDGEPDTSCIAISDGYQDLDWSRIPKYYIPSRLPCRRAWIGHKGMIWKWLRLVKGTGCARYVILQSPKQDVENQWWNRFTPQTYERGPLAYWGWTGYEEAIILRCIQTTRWLTYNKRSDIVH